MIGKTKIDKFFKGLIAAAVIYYLCACLMIILLRIDYPFELEWLEGSSLQMVHRIIDGLNLYTEPSLEYSASTYPPVYYYLSAFLSKFLGRCFLPLRVVSFLASLGTIALIFAIVFRQTHARLAALLSVGFYAATFHIGGAWFDIGRIDTLFVFFVMLALFFVHQRTRMSAFYAGVCFVMAIMTKQTAFMVLLPVLPFVFMDNYRRGLILAVTVPLLTAVIAFILDAYFDGWFLYYNYQLPFSHSMEFSHRWLFFFWLPDILMPLGAACLVSIGVFLPPKASQTLPTRDKWFYLMAACGMLGVSWASRINIGGYNNVLLPAYVWISILFGIGFHSVEQQVQVATDGRRTAIRFVTYALVLFQLTLLAYPIRDQIPTRADREAGFALIEKIRGIDGEVFIPFHGYLAVMAGRKWFTHESTLNELRGLYGKGDFHVWNGLYETLRQKVVSGEIAAIIYDHKYGSGAAEERFGQVKALISAQAKRQEPAFDDPEVFWPVTGWCIRPWIIYYFRE